MNLKFIFIYPGCYFIWRTSNLWSYVNQQQPCLDYSRLCVIVSHLRLAYLIVFASFLTQKRNFELYSNFFVYSLTDTQKTNDLAKLKVYLNTVALKTYNPGAVISNVLGVKVHELYDKKTKVKTNNRFSYLILLLKLSMAIINSHFEWLSSSINRLTILLCWLWVAMWRRSIHRVFPWMALRMTTLANLGPYFVGEPPNQVAFAKAKSNAIFEDFFFLTVKVVICLQPLQVTKSYWKPQ